MKTYGKLSLNTKENLWLINKAEPHICIKLKAIFSKLPKTGGQPFKFLNTPEYCRDLAWFIERYPLEINRNDLTYLLKQKQKNIDEINDIEAIHSPDYVPHPVSLKDGHEGRPYQLKGMETYLKVKHILIGDDIGLGKTLIAILSFLQPKTLPALVIVETHMTYQWLEKITQFTNLKVHVIKVTKPYDLPPADVYISKYSCLAGWCDVYPKKIFKSAVFDEIQQLRHNKTNKYNAACSLRDNTDYTLGLSASPIYNYGDEIFNVMNIIKDGCLGSRDDFMREWIGGYGLRTVKDPQALGSYLRENFLMLRRTRKEVGRELPPVNTIIHTVPYDTEMVEKAELLAEQLAIKVTRGSFVERGQAARDLDILVRQYTGVSKAKYVAEYVKILLENNEPIVLTGWHRDVYEIWLEELKDYNPVMYTGSESPAQKEKSKQAFINGETNLLFLSLRSGIGLDGLQHRSSIIVHGELDWSPKVHEQLRGRLDRDQQKKQVTEIFLVSDCGSDPLIIDMLGLKASQSKGILDPLDNKIEEQHNDDTRIKLLAQRFLEKRKQQQTEITE